MSEKTNRLLLGAVAVCILVVCISRDLLLEKQYTGDLRNRVVGARLQKDGRLPYFYKWTPADGLRYYDPQNFDSFAVSNITASPFTHQLLYPLIELPQRSISKIWLGLEYLLLLLTIIPAFLLARSRMQQWAVLFITTVFLCTAGWKGHIAAGQYYIAIPALFMLFYCAVSSKKIALHAMAGVITAVLILIRPNAVLFLLPFLLLFFSWPAKSKAAFVIAALLPLIFAVSSSQKIAVWKDYRHALNEQMHSHQGYPLIAHNAPDPHYTIWEGWDKQQVAAEAALHPFHFESEHGNLFVVAKRLLGVTIPVWLLATLPFLLLLIFAAHFYIKKKTGINLHPVAIALPGFALYMLSDICSPFYRFQYNAVQWLFPLLVIAAFYNKKNKGVYVLLLAGLLLNIVEIRSIGFEHTFGEWLIFAGLLTLCFRAPFNDSNKYY